MRGSLIYNASLNEDKYREIHVMYQEAAARLGIELYPYPNTAFFLEASQQGLAIHMPEDFPRDFCLFLDKDIVLAEAIEGEGIPIFNKPSTIYNCDNKIKTYRILAKNKLPIPRTIFSHLRFKDESDEEEICNRLEEEFQYPIIIKEAFGSFGEQVYMAKDRAGLVERLRKLSIKPHVYQEYIGTSKGVDLRLQVVNGKVVASMKRVNDHDFRANMNQNACMKKYSPSREEEELAVKAAQAMDCFFCGVDLLFGPGQERIICEVNSNAHIKNIYECTGVDSADIILREIRKTLDWNG